MKGIYLTEEGKKEIEAKIAELEKYDYGDARLNGALEGDLYRLKEILSSATILAAEESWEESTYPAVLPFYLKQQLENNYPNGLVISTQ
jgi:hypothetical protein